MTMITREDVSVTVNPNSITVSAVINGYREKTQYLFVSEDEAVADFLAQHGTGELEEFAVSEFIDSRQVGA